MSRSGTKDRGAGSPTHVRIGRESALCGGAPRHLTHDRSMVECKRCLAALAKRDREFRAKARRWFRPRPPPIDWLRPRYSLTLARALAAPNNALIALRAIAAEETAQATALQAQSDYWTFDLADGWRFYGESGLLAAIAAEEGRS